MYVKTIALQNFRNHTRTLLELSQGINVLVGDNAQGKTNLLEAIYMTCIGRGFRSPRDREIIRFGQDFAKVKSIAAKKFGDISIEVVVATNPNRKQIKINGIPISKMGQLMGAITCVFFHPDELKLVKESPADRRRFMDIDISQIDKIYFYNLLRYNKILKQRNALLKHIGTTDTEMQSLDIWDEQLAEIGEQIISRRMLFCEELKKEVDPVHKVLAPDEHIKVSYEMCMGHLKVNNTSSDPQISFLEALRRARTNDLHLRTTTIGPHRDDILLSINGTDIRSYASQGQQRTVALSLKVAELRIFEKVTGEKPVLLLDDVLSELDQKRQDKLLAHIKDWQSIITATSFDARANSEIKIFNVTGGKVVPLRH